MTEDAKSPRMTDRRSLLGMAVAGAGASLAGIGAIERPDDAEAPRTVAADSYRETPHVLAAYERMRF